MSVTRENPVRQSLRPAVALALVSAALTTGASTAAAAPPTPSGPADPSVRLTPDTGSATKAASVPLTGATAPGLARTATSVQTAKLDTTTYKMVAVTWLSGDPSVEIRYRGTRGWSGWTDLEPLADGPTPRRAEAAAATRQGTELLWVGAADGVQVRSTAAKGLRLELIDPGVLASDARASATKRTTTPAATARTTTRTRAKIAPRPVLKYRSAWKPNPDWLNGTPRYEDEVKVVHVHHTATANAYTAGEVPGLLRGMYRYHTQTLGWFDIGYNFLVDRFGRTWVGRSGGARNRVRGAHTLGFNQNSTGVAVIGNFQSRVPPKVAVDAVMRLAAWKLDRDGNPAIGKINMRSQGSDRYRDGRLVALPRIDGHRDTNETACPGLQLYKKLPSIRTVAQRRIKYYS